MQKEAIDEMNLKFSEFENPGLYLIFSDGNRLPLTKENIELTVETYWSDPTKIPLHVRKATGFQRCHFCPLVGTEDMCDAIRPTIPFLEIVDKYVSYDKVTAVYRDDNQDILYLSRTTMQQALKYVSILSLMYYCRKGRTYWRYFWGINPLMHGREIASRLYLNLAFLHHCNREEIDKVTSKFKEEIKITSKNQVERMNLVCKNDAFLNSFVNTQMITQILSMNLDQALESAFKNSEETLKKSDSKLLLGFGIHFEHLPDPLEFRDPLLHFLFPSRLHLRV